MEYEVILSVRAQMHFRKIIAYLLYKLQNQQAAVSVADDFDDTAARLSHMAGSLKLCDDSILRAQGYRTIHFWKHKYLMVYTIDGTGPVLRVFTMRCRITRISCIDFQKLDFSETIQRQPRN